MRGKQYDNDDFSEQLQKQIATTKDYEKSGDWSNLPNTLKEIENLKKMRKLILEDFPKWPINRKVRRHLRISSLFPIIHFSFTLILDKFDKLIPILNNLNGS